MKKTPTEFTRKKPGQKKKPQARNRLKPKASPIKLFLSEKGDFRKAIRHALDNQYRWIPFNIQEMKTYMSNIELNLNPVNIELISSHHQYIRSDILIRTYLEPYLHSGYPIHIAKELYDYLNLEWNIPPCFLWLHRLIYLWETSRKYKGLKHENLTIKEWFAKLYLDFPQVLESVSNEFIHNRKDLERTGIFEALDLKIKESLGIEDEIEYAVHNWKKLEPLEKVHIKLLFETKAISKNHDYHILLKELIEQE